MMLKNVICVEIYSAEAATLENSGNEECGHGDQHCRRVNKYDIQDFILLMRDGLAFPRYLKKEQHVQPTIRRL